MEHAEDSVEVLLASGREALSRGQWGEARERFEVVLETSESAPAWEGLSWAAWWLHDAATTFDARERSFRAYRQAGDPRGAARMAVWLANDSLDFRGDYAVASGWLGRGRRLLDDLEPCAEYGWIVFLEGYIELEINADPAAALRAAREAARIGGGLEGADLEALGLALEGASLVASGQIGEGMARIDEAAALASGEEFELPISPAFAQCILISACERVGDFDRVAQWCVAMRSLGERIDGRHVIGICRSAYGHVLTTRGEWASAETELTGALGDLEATRPGLAPAGLARLAELRLRQGRDAEARELFERAAPLPQAQVGLGALALRAGDHRSAVDAAERILRRLGTATPLEYVLPLELLVRARAGLGELDAAAVALKELEAIVRPLGTPYPTGHVRLLAGELALAAGSRDEARRSFEDAADLFAESVAPYETALARLGLAAALVELNRPEAAAAEADAAREVFATLGADDDAVRAEALLAPVARPGGELTPREREVLRLVAQGLGDAEIAERLVVSPHTVHRHVANVRGKLRQPSRAAAVAYATRAGLL